MAIFITAYMRRSQRDTVSFYDADGALVTLAAGDHVRIKIGRPGETPLLDLSSAGSGSTCSDANPSTVTLVEGDLIPANIKPGAYDIEATIVDSTDSNRTKHAETGVFVLHDTPGGNVGDVA
jgi:hypothetical protein